jgi:hypothetical protein
MWNDKPDRYPMPDGYGYEFLLVGMGTNFYPQPLCWWAGNCSTRPVAIPTLIQKIAAAGSHLSASFSSRRARSSARRLCVAATRLHARSAIKALSRPRRVRIPTAAALPRQPAARLASCAAPTAVFEATTISTASSRQRRAHVRAARVRAPLLRLPVQRRAGRSPHHRPSPCRRLLRFSLPAALMPHFPYAQVTAVPTAPAEVAVTAEGPLAVVRAGVRRGRGCGAPRLVAPPEPCRRHGHACAARRGRSARR